MLKDGEINKKRLKYYLYPKNSIIFVLKIIFFMKYWHILLLTTAILIFSACENEKTFQLVEQEFSVTKDTIIINAPAYSAGFFVKVNSGRLSFALTDMPSWLYSNNNIGEMSPAGIFIELFINSPTEILETRSAVLSLETAIGTKNIVVYYIPENTQESFVKGKIAINVKNKTKTLEIFNPEPNGISWTATIDNNYISLSKSSGQLVFGGSDILTITVNKDKLPAGSYNVSNITFKASGKTYNTEVNIIDQDLVILDRDVVDAVFANQINEIIYISKAPNSITRINPITKASTSISLNLIPFCLAVSEDDKTAVVGCDAKIIVVDLEKMLVKDIFQVDIKVTNISIASNNFAYALSDENGWGYLTEINLSTGVFNKNPHLIYGGAVGKLHPNGKWLYLAENGTSPRDIRKFSLADDGESTYLYDSPYHGEYSIGGKLWFNSNGDKILTNSVILTTSDKMEDDMIYAGKLALPMFDHYFPYVWSASYSNSDNKWYVLLEFSFPSGHTAPSVYAFDSESFEISKLTGLDSFYDENGNSAGFDARFIFNDQSNVYVFQKELNRERWALQTFKK